MESKNKWAVERKVWKISEDGELGAEYPKPDGRMSSLYQKRIKFLAHDFL